MTLAKKTVFRFLQKFRRKDVAEWPFDQPPDCAVFTTTHVMKEGRDIVYVFHDEDDHGWQFHYAGEKGVADSMVVALKEIVVHDPSILEVANLPLGWRASREKRGAPWTKAKYEQTG